ncbi:unnamed protein product [Adineta steineri]|uniref:Smr domain-containing protein n=1 Tax=Adineta steineri TaxID=433720 RepID=A0A814HFB0_9BILA|nr:unnamed protein product [Adineta steineri]CAF1009411.1 unnamed protein product [Adineta steineri]CAF1185161.1 unnamed protein product [Adineta steineri]CAF3557266.1 unnamed protein product [Adineta steineri]CAF4080979.1 unnamed protein product [Adineta steineri]
MGNLLSFTNNDDNSTLSNTSGSFLQSGIPSKAASLRCEARQLMFEAKAASQQSQYEYHSGSKSQAKVLSTKKNHLYKQMEEKNQQAATLIFEHFNRDRSYNVIDLHGLYVNEALESLEHRLAMCRSENILELTVITGMGNNSPNKIAKIKPQVEKFVRENCLKITGYSGHIEIDLSTNNESTAGSYQNTNGCIIL